MNISDADFEQWVAEATALLPKKFADALDNITLSVEPYPSMKVRRQLGLRRGQTLLGLYTGHPLTERGPQYGAYGAVPDRIVLYKRCIEEACRSADEVRREVAETLLHEVGHYFGMTEAQLAEIDLLQDPPADET